MRRIAAGILISVFVIAKFFLFTSNFSFAYDFSEVQIRLDRHKFSSATGGQICITTDSTNSGTESNIQIIFPTGFTVNSTASNWTITTSNIPNDSTAWPGIGTATGVSGQIVTFPSSDLLTDTKYCFNFEAENTLTTPSSNGSYEGIFRTRQANSILDTQEFGISITTNDQITVSATVPANPSDFQAELEIVDTQQIIFRQESVITFRLNYGSYLNTPSDITPEIEWDLGSLGGGQTIEIVQYEPGGTSNAYNNTAPIIDLVNRKISWPISSFPKTTTNQSVTFKLRTTSNYQGTNDVFFGVRGRVLGPGTQTGYSNKSLIYRWNYIDAPTPTPQGDNKSDNRSDGIGFLPKPLKINYVEVRKVTKDSATIYMTTNKFTTPTVSYDHKRTDWENSESSKSYGYEHLIDLSGLIPNTKYYFRVHAQNSDERIDSELFSFSTAAESTPIVIDPTSLIIVSQNIILHDPTFISRPLVPDIIIPTNVQYSIKFKSNSFDQIKKITAISRNSNVLGINNIANIIPNIDSNTFQELLPGQFVTTLTSNNNAGKYNLILRIEDFSGNITEQQIAKLGTVKPMQIVESNTGNPIENARLRFYIYNERLKIYELLSPDIIPIKNPNFSEPDGTVPVVLPAGKYKAEIENIFHENKSIEFTINMGEPTSYPKIELKTVPFNIINFINYYITTLDDLKHTLTHLVETLKTSNRFYDFAGIFALFLFSFLLLESLSHRYSIPLVMIPWFVIYHLTTFYKHKRHEYAIQGVILDSLTQVGIEDALVYFSSPNGKIVSHTKTNNYGEFFATFPTLDIRLTVSHKSYRSFTKAYKPSTTEKRVKINLTKIKKDRLFTLDGIMWYIRFIFSSLFEGMIFITLLLELSLIAKFGVIKVLPFIIVSILSLLLWASLNKDKKILR